MIDASEPSFAADVRDLPAWPQVPADRESSVHVAPDVVPFGWFDAPPSLNRLLGVQWLARLLHPTLFPQPLAPIVKAVHERDYLRTATDAQLQALVRETGLSR